MALAESEKPRLRGVSHQIAAVVALIAGVVLVAWAPSPRAALAAAIYAATLVAQFGISALYHRGKWEALGRERMRRLDHGCIFVLIAGTYTPFCLLALPEETGRILLAIVWSGATIGIAMAVFWLHAPRWMIVLVYIAVGWCVVPYLGQVVAVIGARGITLMATGGILYSVGAVIYAMKRPNPFPRVFGFHEIFHALVIAGSICFFVVVAAVVMGGTF